MSRKVVRSNFTWISIAMFAIVAMIGCVEEDEPELVIPTPGLFEVLTATPRPEATATPEPTNTPAPTATPTPVPSPTPIPTPTAVPLNERSFPANIDPDLVSERPSDEEIFSGWTEYLKDSEVRYVGNNLGTHYCADGTMWFPTTGYGDLGWWAFDWDVKHSPAIAASQWQTVTVGAFARLFSRKDGKTVWPQDREDREVTVGDSWKCAESLVWSEVERASVDPRRITDIHTLEDGSVVFLHDGQITKFDSTTSTWSVVDRAETLRFWRLRYIPEHGFVGLKSDEMWFIDHQTGQFTQGPSLNVSAAMQWLISDDDGSILVGRGAEAEFDELYSPETNRWENVEPKARNEEYLRFLDAGSNFDGAQAGISDVRLDDGRFMVREPASTPPDNLLIYDLYSNELTEVAQSSEARFSGKLLKLSNGNVLLYSGRVQDGFTAKRAETYELYDLAHNSWSPWIPGDSIEPDWAMSDAWLADEDGTVLGSFAHREQPNTNQFGVLDLSTGEWIYFPYPPGLPAGMIVIPMSHKRVLVIREMGFDEPDSQTWLIKLP